MTDRRTLLKGVAATGGLAATGLCTLPALAAKTRAEIIEAAKKEGGLVWYEAFTRAELNAIAKPFLDLYPFVKRFEGIEVPAAQKQARFVQESMAGGPTTDIFLSSSAGLNAFVKRGLVIDGEWDALGIEKSDIKTPTPQLIMYTTAVYVGVYNPNKVKEAELPKSWDDFLDPKWKGRTGAWARSVMYNVMSNAWGEDKTRQYVRKLAALEPRLYKGTFQVAQAVGAGEVDIGISSYDASTRVILKGAPVKQFNLDPTPLSLLYGCVTKHGKNPNTARLFLDWLASDKGAVAFENVTHRGNHLVPTTKTSKLIEGRKLVYFKAGDEVAQSARLNKNETEFSRTLAGR
jgi:iron(III) transport system substrate-binding protein